MSFKIVSFCLYALISALLPLTKAPLVITFCNSPSLSRRVGLNIFNVIESATFHRFLQLWEQEEVTRRRVRGVGRLWERRNVVFRRKFFCGDSPVGRGVVVVQDPVAGAPLLRAMSVHSVAEAMPNCFVEFLIYRLSCRDELMMNQPVNVEERNQHGLDNWTSPAALYSVEEMMMCSTGRIFALFPGHTRKPSFRHQ